VGITETKKETVTNKRQEGESSTQIDTKSETNSQKIEASVGVSIEVVNADVKGSVSHSSTVEEY